MRLTGARPGSRGSAPLRTEEGARPSVVLTTPPVGRETVRLPPEQEPQQRNERDDAPLNEEDAPLRVVHECPPFLNHCITRDAISAIRASCVSMRCDNAKNPPATMPKSPTAIPPSAIQSPVDTRQRVADS